MLYCFQNTFSYKLRCEHVYSKFLTLDLYQTLERKHEQNLKNLWQQEYQEVALMGQMTRKIWLMGMYPSSDYMTDRKEKVKFISRATHKMVTNKSINYMVRNSLPWLNLRPCKL